MMKKLLTGVVTLSALLSSCASVDMESRVTDAGAGKVVKETPKIVAVPVDPGVYEPRVIEVERPVYVPEKTTQPQTPPVRGTAAVEASNAKGILKPSEYSKAAMVYDYDPDWVYEVYTQPLRASDIRLENGEKAAEAPFISDSERWLLGAGVSYENGEAIQHIYVKPAEANLEASLIINTDRRVYHIILRSYREVHMPIVRWRYFSTGMPEHYIGRVKGSGAGTAAQAGEGENGLPSYPDPRSLSFAYRINYGLFQKPSWLPERVYDDGKKTYITFPKDVLTAELPAVFENRSDVVNYRVWENIIIIDKLVTEITVKKEGREITIVKKKK